MCADTSLRERFWRDVAIAAGHGHGDVDPHVIQDAIQGMMRNYGVDEVPGFEMTPEPGADAPDTSDFPRHSAFAPVFRIASRTLSSLGCFNAARPIFVGPPCTLRRRRSRPDPRNPDHFPGGGNLGIQASTDQPNHAIADASPWYRAPPLPPWMPHHFVWSFPTGNLAWSPYPRAGPLLISPAWAADHAPGTMPQWSPGTWPPLDWARDVPIRLSPYLIPNPNNPHLPLIDWNVSQHPSTAKRLTANHVVVDMDSLWADAVTSTRADTVVVTCDMGHASALWGPIVVRHDQDPVTVRDLFDAIYHHFQVPLTYPEVQYICALNPGNFDRLADAYWERCRESVALPGWEARQGFRRVDVLGDRKHWWGVWISSHYGAWYVNLGLMNPSHRIPPR